MNAKQWKEREYRSFHLYYNILDLRIKFKPQIEIFKRGKETVS